MTTGPPKPFMNRGLYASATVGIMTMEAGFRGRLDTVAAISDPVERAVAAADIGIQIRAEAERAMGEAGRLRGEAIIAARREHGWTQVQAGQRFGLTPGRVSQLERLATAGA